MYFILTLTLVFDGLLLSFFNNKPDFPLCASYILFGIRLAHAFISTVSHDHQKQTVKTLAAGLHAHLRMARC